MKIEPSRFGLDLFSAPMYGDGASLTDVKLAKPLSDNLVPEADYLHGSWQQNTSLSEVHIKEPPFVTDYASISTNRIIIQPVINNDDADVYEVDPDEDNSFESNADNLFEDCDVEPIDRLNDDESNTCAYVLQDFEYGVAEETIDMILKLVEPDIIVGKAKAVDLAVCESSELTDRLGIQIQRGDGNSEIEMIFEMGDVTSLENIFVPIITSLVNRGKTLLVKSKNREDHSELIISLDRPSHEIDITIDDFSDDDNRGKLIPLLKEFMSNGFTVNLDIKDERPLGIDDFSIQQICGEVFNETKIQIELTEQLKSELNEDQPCFRLEPQKVRRGAA